MTEAPEFIIHGDKFMQERVEENYLIMPRKH